MVHGIDTLIVIVGHKEFLLEERTTSNNHRTIKTSFVWYFAQRPAWNYFENHNE
jgi:hypothetical protein